MEGALATFVGASWCTIRGLPENQGGRGSRDLDDHSSCHKTASKRVKSEHRWGGWRNSLQSCLLPGSATLFRKRNHPSRDEVETAGTIWDHYVSNMKHSTRISKDIHQGQHWISVQFLVLDFPIMWFGAAYFVVFDLVSSKGNREYFTDPVELREHKVFPVSPGITTATRGTPLSPPHNSHQVLKPNIVH